MKRALITGITGQDGSYEIKWQGKRPATRAFQARYGVEVRLLDAGNPFMGRRALGPE